MTIVSFTEQNLERKKEIGEQNIVNSHNLGREI